MNKRELIRLFREKAERAGKPLDIKPVRHGTRITCEGHSVTLPHKPCQFNQPLPSFERRLGLRPQQFVH